MKVTGLTPRIHTLLSREFMLTVQAMSLHTLTVENRDKLLSHDLEYSIYYHHVSIAFECMELHF